MNTEDTAKLADHVRNRRELENAGYRWEVCKLCCGLTWYWDFMEVRRLECMACNQKGGRWVAPVML